MSDDAFSTMAIPAECAGMRDDGFADGGHLRQRNCASGGGWLDDWEAGVLYSEHHRLKTLVKASEIPDEVEKAIGSLE